METTSIIKRWSATDEAFKILHDMIMSGKLNQGDKLPSQDKLAAQFGLSRNTIREAINKLIAMGLLTVRQGVGTIINISGPSGYIASISDHLLLQPSTVREFMEARVVIERATVRFAVLRSDTAALARLEENVRNQKEALRTRNVDAFIRYDVGFHFGLAEACGNKVLVQFLSAITDLMSRFIKEVVLLPRATHNAYSFHKDILKCIRDRDADAAERKLIEHLNDVVRNIEKTTGMELGTTFHFMAGKKEKA